KIVAGGLQRSAQESAGKMRGVHQDRLHKARQRQQEAAEAVRKDSEICVDLPETTVPSGRDVLRLSGLCLGHGLPCGDELLVRGPERIAWWGATVLVRPRCCVPSVVTSFRGRGRPVPWCRCVFCLSGWMCSRRNKPSLTTWHGWHHKPVISIFVRSWPGSCSVAGGPSNW